MFVDTKGRFEATVTPEVIDWLEREGKKLIYTVEMRDGRPWPTFTVEDWPAVPLTEKADAPANCQHCDGSGHSHGWPGVISSPCKFCNGTGKRSEP